jgi:hypothetical protein
MVGVRIGMSDSVEDPGGKRRVNKKAWSFESFFF